MSNKTSMTIGDAARKAMANGWEGTPEIIAENGVTFLLDPLFWQALGKAMGWEKVCENCGRDTMRGGFGYSECCEKWFDSKNIAEWLWKWHRMIDHLANGGTIESFFETL